MKIIIVLIFILLTQNVVTVQAQYSFLPEYINIVNRLDLFGGKVQGEQAEYSLVFPRYWNNYLIADKEFLPSSSTALEKIHFYYVPQNKVYKPVLLTTFYVFDKKVYSAYDVEIKKFLETKNYVFAVKAGSSSGLEGETDKALYNYFFNQLNEEQSLTDLIILPPTQQPITAESIYINGIKQKADVFRKGSTCYLPVREVSEALGYKVGWIAQRRVVTLTGNGRYFLLLTDNSIISQPYSTMFIKDRIYVSSLFFMREMGTNIEIDENFNVYIHKE